MKHIQTPKPSPSLQALGIRGIGLTLALAAASWGCSDETPSLSDSGAASDASQHRDQQAADDAGVDLTLADAASVDVVADAPGDSLAGDALPADGSAGDAALADAPSGCLASPITWRGNGGLVAFHDVSALTNCVDFSLRRTWIGGTPPPKACQTLVAPNSPNLVAVLTALARSDVQQTLGMGGFFGYDTRPADGVALEVTVVNQTVLIGSACNGRPNCTPIPTGLSQLRTALTGLTTSERAKPACAAIVP